MQVINNFTDEEYNLARVYFCENHMQAPTLERYRLAMAEIERRADGKISDSQMVNEYWNEMLICVAKAKGYYAGTYTIKARPALYSQTSIAFDHNFAGNKFANRRRPFAPHMIIQVGIFILICLIINEFAKLFLQ